MAVLDQAAGPSAQRCGSLPVPQRLETAACTTESLLPCPASPERTLSRTPLPRRRPFPVLRMPPRDGTQQGADLRGAAGLLPAHPCTVLEVTSGSGEHALWMARALAQVTWVPSEATAGGLADIDRWRGLCPDLSDRVPTPVLLDATQPPWPGDPVDAVFVANLIHIAPGPRRSGWWRALPPGSLPEGYFSSTAASMRAATTRATETRVSTLTSAGATPNGVCATARRWTPWPGDQASSSRQSGTCRRTSGYLSIVIPVAKRSVVGDAATPIFRHLQAPEIARFAERRLAS